MPLHKKGIDHEINFVEGKIDDDVPTMPLYQMSKDQLLVLRKTLTELLDNGFIRVSNSPTAAPVIFVKKPSGGLRFCIDCHRLNEINRKDSYPILRIDETLRTIAAANTFQRWMSFLHFIGFVLKMAMSGRRPSTHVLAYMNGWLHLSNSPAHQQRFNNISIGFFVTNSIFVVPRI